MSWPWPASRSPGTHCKQFCMYVFPKKIKPSLLLHNTVLRIQIRDEQPGSYFLELRNHFLKVKILKFFDADPGSGMEKSRIRDPGSGIWDKHPGSATLTQIFPKQKDLYGVIIFCGEVQNYICNHLAASIIQMAIRI
jgi:hypothetical protein